MKVKLSDIKVGERSRKQYIGIEELAESIDKHGLLHPLVVDSDMNLIAGGRRLQALLHLNKDACDVTQINIETEIGRKQCELVENIQRENLTWQEEISLKAEIDRLHKEIYGDKKGANVDNKKWSMRKTAALLGEGISNTSRDIELAQAINMVPELKNCATKGEAQRKFSILAEEVAMKELQKRAAEAVTKTDEEEIATNFKNWYVVGDALENMQQMLDTKEHHNFTIAEVDPPYGIDINKLKHYKVSDTYHEVEAGGVYIDFITTTAKLVYELLNKDAWCVWWFAMQYYAEILHILRHTGFVVDEIPAVWVKKKGQTRQPDKNLGRAWEGFFLCRKGSPLMNKRGRINVFEYSSVSHQVNIHTTERPLELILDIIQTLCPPASGRILVPFLGSGNTLRAALFNGMTGLGWDIDGAQTQALFLSRLLADFKKIKEDAEAKS